MTKFADNMEQLLYVVDRVFVPIALQGPTRVNHPSLDYVFSEVYHLKTSSSSSMYMKKDPYIFSIPR